MQFFLEQLRKEVEGEVALVGDRAGSHRALVNEMPQGITKVLPRASPELNPIEQVWKALRKKLANRLLRRWRICRRQYVRPVLLE